MTTTGNSRLDDDDDEYWNGSAMLSRTINWDAPCGPDDLRAIVQSLKQDAFSSENLNQPFDGLLETSSDSDFVVVGPGDVPAYYESARKRSGTSSNTGASGPTYTEIAKLEAKVQHLQRKEKDPLPVDEIVLKIIREEPYSLENYRSREYKVGLLDSAIKFHDGNSIIIAVMHLKHNTKPSIFRQEMMQRPEAINHYFSHLKMHSLWTELSDFLQMLGRTDEAAMVRYKMALNTPKVENVIKHLQNCIRNHFQGEPSLGTEAMLLQEHCALLEKQLPVEESDAKQERAGTVQIFKEYPRERSLVNRSVLDTLYYCYFYHYGLTENHYASPVALKKEHQLSNKQFAYIAIAVMADKQQWGSINNQLFTKGILGKVKLNADINLSNVLDMLHKKGGPATLFNAYVKYEQNTETRLELAYKFKCPEIVIEVLTRMRDKEQLNAYKNKLHIQSPERRMAEEALRKLP